MLVAPHGQADADRVRQEGRAAGRGRLGRRRSRRRRRLRPGTVDVPAARRLGQLLDASSSARRRACRSPATGTATAATRSVSTTRPRRRSRLRCPTSTVEDGRVRRPRRACPWSATGMPTASPTSAPGTRDRDVHRAAGPEQDRRRSGSAGSAERPRQRAVTRPSRCGEPDRGRGQPEVDHVVALPGAESDRARQPDRLLERHRDAVRVGQRGSPARPGSGPWSTSRARCDA